jgi:fatty acid synthase subunit alpha, fungi type
MAWIMGLITFHHGPLKRISHYSGWIDVATQEPVQDFEVKLKYEPKILEHSGIRLIEPELFGGYDPKRKELFQEVSITDDLAPMEVSREEMEAFKLRHGDAALVEKRGEQYFIRLKKGSTIMIPKSLRLDRMVAGQIPTGWSARRYGIPEDIINQVDPVTLYSLVATAEAIITSGITDPYELYKYVHVSEVGSSLGSGMGGMVSMKKMFQVRSPINFRDAARTKTFKEIFCRRLSSTQYLLG